LHRGFVSSLTAGAECWERTRIRPGRESNHDVSVVQPVAQSLYRLSSSGSPSDDDDDGDDVDIKINEKGIEFEAVM
jgi:hypothetical protein